MSVLVDALAAWGALSIASCALVVWWGIARGRRRDRRNAEQDDEAIEVTRELNDAAIEQAVAEWKKRHGND